MWLFVSRLLCCIRISWKGQETGVVLRVHVADALFKSHPTWTNGRSGRRALLPRALPYRLCRRLRLTTCYKSGCFGSWWHFMLLVINLLNHPGHLSSCTGWKGRAQLRLLRLITYPQMGFISPWRLPAPRRSPACALLSPRLSQIPSCTTRFHGYQWRDHRDRTGELRSIWTPWSSVTSYVCSLKARLYLL